MKRHHSFGNLISTLPVTILFLLSATVKGQRFTDEDAEPDQAVLAPGDSRHWQGITAVPGRFIPGESLEPTTTYAPAPPPPDLEAILIGERNAPQTPAPLLEKPSSNSKAESIPGSQSVTPPKSRIRTETPKPQFDPEIYEPLWMPLPRTTRPQTDDALSLTFSRLDSAPPSDAQKEVAKSPIPPQATSSTSGDPAVSLPVLVSPPATRATAANIVILTTPPTEELPELSRSSYKTLVKQFATPAAAGAFDGSLLQPTSPPAVSGAQLPGVISPGVVAPNSLASASSQEQSTGKPEEALLQPSTASAAANLGQPSASIIQPREVANSNAVDPYAGQTTAGKIVILTTTSPVQPSAYQNLVRQFATPAAALPASSEVVSSQTASADGTSKAVDQPGIQVPSSSVSPNVPAAKSSTTPSLSRTYKTAATFGLPTPPEFPSWSPLEQVLWAATAFPTATTHKGNKTKTTPPPTPPARFVAVPTGAPRKLVEEDKAKVAASAGLSQSGADLLAGVEPGGRLIPGPRPLLKYRERIEIVTAPDTAEFVTPPQAVERQNPQIPQLLGVAPSGGDQQPTGLPKYFTPVIPDPGVANGSIVPAESSGSSWTGWSGWSPCAPDGFQMRARGCYTVQGFQCSGGEVSELRPCELTTTQALPTLPPRPPTVITTSLATSPLTLQVVQQSTDNPEITAPTTPETSVPQTSQVNPGVREDRQTSASPNNPTIHEPSAPFAQLTPRVTAATIVIATPPTITDTPALPAATPALPAAIVVTETAPAVFATPAWPSFPGQQLVQQSFVQAAPVPTSSTSTNASAPQTTPQASQLPTSQPSTIISSEAPAFSPSSAQAPGALNQPPLSSLAAKSTEIGAANRGSSAEVPRQPSVTPPQGAFFPVPSSYRPPVYPIAPPAYSRPAAAYPVAPSGPAYPLSPAYPLGSSSYGSFAGSGGGGGYYRPPPLFRGGSIGAGWDVMKIALPAPTQSPPPNANTAPQSSPQPASSSRPPSGRLLSAEAVIRPPVETATFNQQRLPVLQLPTEVAQTRAQFAQFRPPEASRLPIQQFASEAPQNAFQFTEFRTPVPPAPTFQVPPSRPPSKVPDQRFLLNSQQQQQQQQLNFQDKQQQQFKRPPIIFDPPARPVSPSSSRSKLIRPPVALPTARRTNEAPSNARFSGRQSNTVAVISPDGTVLGHEPLAPSAKAGNQLSRESFKPAPIITSDGRVIGHDSAPLRNAIDPRLLGAAPASVKIVSPDGIPIDIQNFTNIQSSPRQPPFFAPIIDLEGTVVGQERLGPQSAIEEVPPSVQPSKAKHSKTRPAGQPSITPPRPDEPQRLAVEKETREVSSGSQRPIVTAEGTVVGSQDISSLGGSQGPQISPPSFAPPPPSSQPISSRGSAPVVQADGTVVGSHDLSAPLQSFFSSPWSGSNLSGGFVGPPSIVPTGSSFTNAAFGPHSFAPIGGPVSNSNRPSAPIVRSDGTVVGSHDFSVASPPAVLPVIRPPTKHSFATEVLSPPGFSPIEAAVLKTRDAVPIVRADGIVLGAEKLPVLKTEVSRSPVPVLELSRGSSFAAVLKDNRTLEIKDLILRNGVLVNPRTNKVVRTTLPPDDAEEFDRRFRRSISASNSSQAAEIPCHGSSHSNCSEQRNFNSSTSEATITGLAEHPSFEVLPSARQHSNRRPTEFAHLQHQKVSRRTEANTRHDNIPASSKSQTILIAF